MKYQESESKREDNWKKYPYLFNEDKNLNFECECGKKYVSFPGLYLHFQRKHGLKISTKINPDQCVVINEGYRTTYKYMYQLKRTKKDYYESYVDTSSSEKENVSTVLQRFIENSQKQLQEKLGSGLSQDFREQIRKIIGDFQNFIFEKLPQKTIVSNPQTILYQIPNYCNPFMQQVRKQNKFPFEYKQICQILLHLGIWLRKQGFSELILQLI